MKIAFEVTAETAADLLQQLKDFIHDGGVGDAKKTPAKKPDADNDDEPAAPKKRSAPAKKAPEHTHESVRATLAGTGWETEEMKAFTKKFGYDRIPEVPAEELEAYAEKLEEVIGYTDAKRQKYLGTDL